MTRYTKSSYSRGSLRDIQILVNQHADYLNALISKEISKSIPKVIQWVSPIKEDDYAEYRDTDFIKKLGLSLEAELKNFWPSSGPQWDALGKSVNGDVFIVEAKANIPEVVSDGTKATHEISLRMINKALKKTKDYLNIKNDVDWSGKFYQYTNRIAHLYLLREQNDIPAYLINIYFYNDKTVDSPTSKEEWIGAIKVLKNYLGIPKNHKLSAYMIDLFIDMNVLY